MVVCEVCGRGVRWGHRGIMDNVFSPQWSPIFWTLRRCDSFNPFQKSADEHSPKLLFETNVFRFVHHALFVGGGRLIQKMAFFLCQDCNATTKPLDINIHSVCWRAKDKNRGRSEVQKSLLLRPEKHVPVPEKGGVQKEKITNRWSSCARPQSCLPRDSHLPRVGPSCE